MMVIFVVVFLFALLGSFQGCSEKYCKDGRRGLKLLPEKFVWNECAGAGTRFTT
jgi:uncharacterized membrane protein